MSDKVDSPKISHLWTMEMVAEILKPLRPKTRERLRRIVWLDRFPDPDLASATLMMTVVSRYAFGARPDDLIEALVSAAADPAAPLSREDAKELVMIGVLLARSAIELPEPRWWEPSLHAEHLAIACARVAIASGEGAERLLRERLGFGAEQTNEMLETAAHEAGISFAIDRDAAGGLAPRLTSHLEGEVAGATMRETLEAMPETVEHRIDIAFAAVQAAQMRVARVGAKRDGDEDLTAFLDTQFDALVKAAAGMSRLEVDLMRSIDPDEQLLIDVAAIAKKTLSVSARKSSGSKEEVTPTGLTDLIDGERELEPGLDLYLGLAGQTYQQRVGPIISWSITFERVLPDGFDGADELKIGVGFDEAIDTEFIVRSTYDGEDADSHIYYPAGSPTATLALAVLALTQVVRLDFYVLSGTRSIRHVSQNGIPLKEPLTTMVIKRAVERSRELMADGEGEAVKKLTAEHSGKEAPLIAFFMNDSGKSEQLLDARSPAAALGPGRTATPEQVADLAAGRHRLLEAEADRIMNPSDSTEKIAQDKVAAYTALVQRFRPPAERNMARRSNDDLEQLVDGVATRHRAIIHLTIDARGLELAWVDRAEGKVNVELLTCDDVDLDVLGQALADPEAGSIHALDNPDGPGVALGKRLAEQAARRGVNQLLICATRHLHQLPVHALRIGPEEDRRLIDVAEVTYAPSAAIVAGLASLEPRIGPTLIIAGGDLAYAADEASLVDREIGGGETLEGDQATPAAVLEGLRTAGRVHICTHGEYEPQDYLASGLLLPTDADPDRRLVVATILANADLSGIDLAVLGACQSGAGQTTAASLDVAGGIDTAFLAAGVRNVLSALWEIDDFGALLFHGEFHRCLAEGSTLFEAYRAAVALLRSGDWKRVEELPLGAIVADLGIDLAPAFAELEPGDDGVPPLDFSDLVHWAPFRICGVGSLSAIGVR